MDCNLSGSSVHGIFQARVLEWVAISFSQGISPARGLNPGLAHCRQTPGRSTTFQNKKVETKMVLLYMFTSCPPGLTEHHSPPLQAHLAHCRLPTHSPPTGCHSQSLRSVLGTRRRGGRRWWPPLCSAHGPGVRSAASCVDARD